MKIGIGLYGSNGHQIHQKLIQHPKAELVATVAFDEKLLSPQLAVDKAICHYNSLEEMIKDERVQLVSLCSPKRADQARDAIRCLEAGKHVYAEKPCALTEKELDAIIETSKRTGRMFHEMAGTAFEQPYLSLMQIVKTGTIGEVVQVLAQKSYPFYDGRPQNEEVDGGLICQNAIHAVRFIEHVAGQPIKKGWAVETKNGNPDSEGELRMAASMMFELENGALASVAANYLNPRGFGQWGNDHLRIFGTKGFIEAVDGGARTRLVVGDMDLGAVDTGGQGQDYFDMYLDSILGVGVMPFSLEKELHPTRVVIRLKGEC